MRNLTIKREKKFVGCLAKARVYIEDAQLGDTVIDGVKCTKLGELKSGEEKTFSIGEEGARLYVIADKLSKNYCNDCFEIPAGSEDVSVSGENRFSIFAGNPFIFNVPVSEDVSKKRKKKARIGALVLVLAIIIGLAAGFFISNGAIALLNGRPKTFSENGFEITLTSKFTKVNLESFKSSYNSEDVAVFIVEEDFDSLPNSESMTVEEYAALVISANAKNAKIFKEDGLLRFEYTAESTTNGKTFHYTAYVFKGDNSFWIVQFAVSPEKLSEYKNDFADWARSVKVS